jgi:hypothetical protein
MNSIRRRVSAAVNPVSTAVTRWWCYSAMRHLLTGHGSAAGHRRLIKANVRGRRAGRGRGDAGFMPSAAQMKQMKVRQRAIDELMASPPGPTGTPPDS